MMDASYEEEIARFVAKHLLLIDEERKEECDQSQKLIQLSHSGICLTNLNISSYSSCLGGFVLVEFRSAKSKVLPTHSLFHGDVVGVLEGTDMQDTQLASGVVKFCKDEVIAVSFEDVNFNEDEHVIYSLVKLANDITYSRLKASLRSLASINKYPGRVVAELLFGSNNDLEEIELPSSVVNESGEIMFVNINLHPDQKEAVKFSLKMKNLAVIHGPPGTGKTTTLVEIILQMIKMGNKILVCTPSNVAVDNLLEKLSRHRVNMVRLGHPARIMEEFLKYSLDAIVDTDGNSEIVKEIRKEVNETLRKLKSKCSKRMRAELRSELKNLRKELQQRESRALDEVLHRADIVLSTLVTASDNGPLKHVAKNHFDCVIIDECSQALEAACWIVLPRATKTILAGDHLQLPPTILSKKAELEGLGMSLMERAVSKFGDRVCRLLKCQFRMHADIMMWPSNEMYNGVLEADSSVANHLLKDLPSVKSTDETEMTLLFVDTSDSLFEEETFENSRCNRGEAGIVSVLVKRLIAANVSETSVAVITPYNYQVEMIRSYLEDMKGVEVRSVDGFQGREKEAVFLSLVRSNPHRELGFISDRRRLNVAVSRARRFLCVVADSRTVCHDNTIKSLIDYISESGIVHTSDQYVSHVETPKDVIQHQKFKSTQVMQGESKSNKTTEKVQKKSQLNQLKQFQNLKVSAECQQNKNENEDGKDHWLSVLQDFINSNQQDLKFSNSISSYDRRLIHEAAEKLKINHVSVGEGNERYIVVSKPSETNILEGKKSKSKNSISTSKGNKLAIDSDISVSVQPNEDVAVSVDPLPKEALKKAHRQTASQQNVSKKLEVADSELHKNIQECQDSQITGTKKQEKINKKSNKKQDSEDLDSILAEFQEKDKWCPWGKCKTPTELVGLTCEHCKQRFCLTHAFPEVHGCGEAARKLARQKFRKPCPPRLDPLKRNAASKKLEKKLQQMADDRKPHRKDT